MTDADAVWDVEADNTLGVLNSLKGALDTGDAAVVVSPAFEGVPLVDQHKMVYDALKAAGVAKPRIDVRNGGGNKPVVTDGGNYCGRSFGANAFNF